MPNGAIVGIGLALFGGPVSMLFACILGICGVPEIPGLLCAVPFSLSLCGVAFLIAKKVN